MPSLIRVFALVFAGILGAAAPFAARDAEAQLSLHATSDATLRQAILLIARDYAIHLDRGPYVLTIGGNITLNQSLPMIRGRLPVGSAAHVIIEGSGRTIDAANAGRVFFVASGRVAIRNLTIKNARVQGGAGGWSSIGGGGGGGLGAGAALFVNKHAEVLATNVIVENARARGGTGGDYGAGQASGDNAKGGGGGGGLEGRGGDVGSPFNGFADTSDGGGGGGGYGAGANGGDLEGSADGGAGGGGEFGPGGHAFGSGGGGGGGRNGTGGSAHLGGGGGGGGDTASGANNPGVGAVNGGLPEGGSSFVLSDGGMGTPMGGGGGGFDSSAGGAGGLSGGGGGGGSLGRGGDGGDGGGGGGAGSSDDGGFGGEFGGGGGAGGQGAGGYGGRGGFGGGGGGGTNANRGGAGGFGGGGGGAGVATVKPGGAYGGSGRYGGGGGAALGGAVFVREGGGLTLTDTIFTGVLEVTPGTAGSGDATAGQALGKTLFLMAGTGVPTSFDITATNTRAITGDGAIAGDGEVLKKGTGTLVVSGINSHSGRVTIDAGTLAVTGQIASPITLKANATLAGTGTILATVTATGGTIAPGGVTGIIPGPGPGVLGATKYTLSTAATLAIEINGAGLGSGYDRLAAITDAELNGATLAVTLNYLATPGTQYTIVTNATGQFAGLSENALIPAGPMRLRVSYIGGVNGRDVVLTAELPATPPPPQGPPTDPPDPPDPPTGTPLTYYLAEGATGQFFDTDLLLANPQAIDAPVTIDFLRADGTSVIVTRTLAPLSRTTIAVDDVQGLESTAVSTRVTSTAGVPIVVERTMRWDASSYGAHTEKATAGAAPEWFFAEGAQGFFSTFLLLVNPHATANVAHVTWLRENEPALQREYELGPSSRVTIDTASEPDLVNRSFGARVVFDQPGAAERAMYFGTSPFWSGGHASAGAVAPSTHWLLAEGATGGYFTTFVLVANPNDAPADLTFTWLPTTGSPVITTKRLEARQRLTLNIANEHPSLASAAVSTNVVSTVPVVVERAQYWPQPAWHEAHNSFGVTESAKTWGLAEGRVGGPRAEQTYILLANAGTQPSDVTITFVRENGATPVVKTFRVQASSRFNVAIAGANSDVPELIDESFGARIDATQPIVVERSVYGNANGVTWAAGTNATATLLP